MTSWRVSTMRMPLPPMPWFDVAVLSDADLKAAVRADVHALTEQFPVP